MKFIPSQTKTYQTNNFPLTFQGQECDSDNERLKSYFIGANIGSTVAQEAIEETYFTKDCEYEIIIEISSRFVGLLSDGKSIDGLAATIGMLDAAASIPNYYKNGIISDFIERLKSHIER